MDAKSEQKVINNLSKIVQETNGADDNSLHSVKSDCSKKEKEAPIAVADIAMNSKCAYPMPLNAAPANSYSQSTDHLASCVMDEKSEQKVINDLSKTVQETRGADDKSDSGTKEKEDKIIHPDRNNHETHHISHDRASPISAVKPHALHQQQHPSAHYSPDIQQLNYRVVFQQECYKDSPIVRNLYADQGRIPQIPGPVDDHNKSESLSSYHHKSDNTDLKQYRSPATHQQTQFNTPYHSRGVLPSMLHSDRRTSNPAHSSSSYIHKKDSSHNQQIPPLHNPANVKRPKTEHSNKEHSRTHHQESLKGSSISPGPVGLPAASSPLPLHMTPTSHSAIPQSLRVRPNNELPNCRMNAQIASHIHSDVRVRAPPPPAHAMSQHSNAPARTLHPTLSHSNRIPMHDAFVLQRYPTIWQGVLAIKNSQVPVQMHFISGNPNIARASLPSNVNGEAPPVRIAQRMRLDPPQLDGVYRKIQLSDEHCILMASPVGKDRNDLIQQTDNLKFDFISYLLNKDAAGIVNAITPGSQQPSFIIHIFPSCEFIRNNLSRIAPNLLQCVDDTSQLWIVIGTA